MICLRKFAKDCKVTLLKCGHVICELCLDFTVKVDCPIHNNKPFEKIDFAAKIPKTAGVRILSLDGGSGVRGLIECKILGAIETITGYKVCDKNEREKRVVMNCKIELYGGLKLSHFSKDLSTV